MAWFAKNAVLFAILAGLASSPAARAESELRNELFYLPPLQIGAKSVAVQIYVAKTLRDSGWLLKDCVLRYVEMKAEAFRKLPKRDSIGEKSEISAPVAAPGNWIEKIRGIKILDERDPQKNGTSWEQETGFLVIRVRPDDLPLNEKSDSNPPAVIGANGHGLKHPLCRSPIATDSFALVDQIHGIDVRDWAIPSRLLAQPHSSPDSLGVSDERHDKADRTLSAIKK